ncbi:MAG: sugar transferase [Gemmatirosa sp.]
MPSPVRPPHPPEIGGRPDVSMEGGLATRVRTRRRPRPETPVVPLQRPSRARLATKRLIDVVGATVGLLLALPVMLVLAIAIKIHSPGPVFFAQSRIGRGGRTFRCFKLRTMCVDAEERLAVDDALRVEYERNHYKLPAHADHRITGLGRFLRTTSLDELPQFYNVLRGDMALVGPRPVVAAELAHYGATRDVLLSVRPGVTGAWAVRGRSRIGYPERAAIEVGYARTWTIRRDLAILARTVGVVLQRRGAY